METVTALKAGGMSIGGAGVVGATGYGAYVLVQPANIGEYLQGKGLDLLDPNKDDSTWTELANKYPNKETSNVKKFPGVAALAGSDDGSKVTDLKQKCKDTLAKKWTSTESETEEVVAAETWCTKSKTVTPSES